MKQSDKNVVIKQNSRSAAVLGASSAPSAASSLPPTSPPSFFEPKNKIKPVLNEAKDVETSSEDETMHETGVSLSEPISDVAISSARWLEISKPKRERSVEKEFSFEEFEKSLFAKTREDLKCVHCRCSALVSSGVGGEVNQFNVRLLQVKCKECGRKMRVKDLLIKAGLKEDVQEYEEKLKGSNLTKKIKKEKAKNKEKLEETNVSEALNQDKANVKEWDPVLDGPDDLDDHYEIWMLRDENKLLKSQMLKLTAEVSKNRKLIAKLLEEQKKYNSSKISENEEVLLSKEQTNLDKERNKEPELSSIKKEPVKEAIRHVRYSSSDSLNETNKDSKESWSEVVKKNRPRKQKEEGAYSAAKIKRMAVGLTKKRNEPLEFKRFHIEIFDTRTIKQAKKDRMISKIIWKMLRIMGISKWILEYSLIGNSILEVYVKASHEQEIKEMLAKNELHFIENFDLSARPEHARTEDFEKLLVKRLKFLYKRAHLVNLRKCILEGLDDDVVAQITGQDRDLATQDFEGTGDMAVDTPEGDVQHA